MPTALLETKLYVPRSRHGLVQRLRLGDRLDRETASKLTLVPALAGFGNDDNAGGWMATGATAPGTDRPAAWLSRGPGYRGQFCTSGPSAAQRTLLTGRMETAPMTAQRPAAAYRTP